MKQFGLIGKRLTHSFSADWFNAKFSKGNIAAIYNNFPLNNIEEFPELLTANSFSGLNVTIPYKKSVIRYMDELHQSAEITGAVNTIKFLDKNGQHLKGFNTDYLAFRETIIPLLGNRKKALILGTGGAAAAVKAALNDLNIVADFVSRQSAEKVYIYADITKELLSEYTIIINCTPLGMFPDINAFPPIPYQYITKSHLVYDLIYNPDETMFLSNAKETGAQIKNGREMLIQQAELAWGIWNDNTL